MKIIFNNDGSLKYLSLDTFINQGDNLTKFVEVAIEGRDNEDYTMSANFQLPNGEVNSLIASEIVNIVVDGTTYEGRKIALTSAQTLYKGIVKMSLKIVNLQDETLFTYATNLTINPTVYDPDELQISNAQWDSLMQLLNQFALKKSPRAIRFYESLTSANSEIDSMEINQVSLVLDNNANIVRYYQKQSGHAQLVELSLTDIVLQGYLTQDQADLIYQKILVAGKNIKIDSATNTISCCTKTITEDDIMWELLWQTPRQANTNVANLNSYVDNNISSLPIFIKAGTVINIDRDMLQSIYEATGVRPYFAITRISKTEVVDLLMNRIDLFPQTSVTTQVDGYYCFSIFNGGTGKDHVIKKYGKPVTFSYEEDKDFEPNYVLREEWGKVNIFTGTDAILYSFDNYLEWACHRKHNQPIIISNTGKGSINPCYMYQYTTNDFSGSRSSTSRQNIIKIKDELWLVGPSIDGGVGIGCIHKLKVYPNGWVDYLGLFWHNFGHLNSMSYDDGLDLLTFGNGSYDYDLEGVGTIIKNFSKTSCMTSYNDEIVLLSDLSANVEQSNYPISTYGFKFNLITLDSVCESNASYLRFIMVVNDGNTIRYGKCPLNSISLSNITWESAIDVGNTSESTSQSYQHAVGTVCLFNGKVSWLEGHSDTPIARITRQRDKTYKLESSFLEGLNAIGSICDYNGKLLVGTRNQIVISDIVAL